MSALPLRAAEKQTSEIGSFGPTTDIQVTGSCTDRELIGVLPARPRRTWRCSFAAVCRRRCVPSPRRQLADYAQPVFDMVGAHELAGLDGVNIDRRAPVAAAIRDRLATRSAQAHREKQICRLVWSTEVGLTRRRARDLRQPLHHAAPVAVALGTQLNDLAPDKPLFLYTCPVQRTSRHRSAIAHVAYGLFADLRASDRKARSTPMSRHRLSGLSGPLRGHKRTSSPSRRLDCRPGPGSRNGSADHWGPRADYRMAAGVRQVAVG
jgi:hypothetical protein